MIEGESPRYEQDEDRPQYARFGKATVRIVRRSGPPMTFDELLAREVRAATVGLIDPLRIASVAAVVESNLRNKAEGMRGYFPIEDE